MGISITDLMFPRKCPLCGETRLFGESGVCEKCEKSLPWIKAPVCLKCGKTIDDPALECCVDCIKIPKSFERCYAAFSYEGTIKESLYDFKYKNQREYAVFYCDSIVKKYGDELKKLHIDGVIPVPVHRHKKRVRGYNQAKLLAKELSAAINAPLYADYLQRYEDTEPQKELDDRERMKNLKNAFKIAENVVKLDTVLLVDDIYTSGATMEACTSVLMSVGINKVFGVCAAIGRGY